MWRPNIRNRTFDWMGEGYAPIIDAHHFLGRSPFGNAKWNFPAVNLKKVDDLFVMEVALPGYKKEEVELTVKNEVMTIRGEKKQSRKSDETDFVLEEFTSDSFERKFRLGKNIGREKIDAVMKNGILRISFRDVPKEEEKDSQTVEIV